MAYYVRVFCTARETPTISDVAAWLETKDVRIRIAPLTDGAVSHDWSEADVSEAGRDVAWHVDVNRVVGKPDSVAQEEIEEFRELLSRLPASQAKQQVLDHLSRTIFVVANRIPTTQFSDPDYEVMGYFCEYYVVHSGGMVQADREGFYQGKELLLALR